jgi:hypothetical protein
MTKKAADGQSEVRDFKVTFLGVPKSLCKINPEIKSNTMKYGEKGSIHIAVGTQGKVTDLTKQCPGDKFSMDCNHKVDYIKFDVQSGMLSGYAPKLDKVTITACQIIKKALNGEYEKRDIKLTVLPPPSVCAINPKMTSFEMKAGTYEEMGAVVSAQKATTVVTDIARQCPGDRFYVSCNPKVDFINFDEKTGKASAKAPMLRDTKTTSCVMTKKAANGQSEVRDFKVTFLAVPKSLCKINPLVADVTMKAGTNGAYGIAVFA